MAHSGTRIKPVSLDAIELHQLRFLRMIEHDPRHKGVTPTQATELKQIGLLKRIDDPKGTKYPAYALTDLGLMALGRMARPTK